MSAGRILLCDKSGACILEGEGFPMEALRTSACQRVSVTLGVGTQYLAAQIPLITVKQASFGGLNPKPEEEERCTFPTDWDGAKIVMAAQQTGTVSLSGWLQTYPSTGQVYLTTVPTKSATTANMVPIHCWTPLSASDGGGLVSVCNLKVVTERCEPARFVLHYDEKRGARTMPNHSFTASPVPQISDFPSNTSSSSIEWQRIDLPPVVRIRDGGKFCEGQLCTVIDMYVVDQRTITVMVRKQSTQIQKLSCRIGTCLNQFNVTLWSSTMFGEYKSRTMSISYCVCKSYCNNWDLNSTRFTHIELTRGSVTAGTALTTSTSKNVAEEEEVTQPFLVDENVPRIKQHRQETKDAAKAEEETVTKITEEETVTKIITTDEHNPKQTLTEQKAHD